MVVVSPLIICMSRFFYKLKNCFNLKYSFNNLISRLIWIFGCFVLMLFFVPSQSVSARSVYNYYNGELGLYGNPSPATGIYTKDDFVYYQSNGNSSFSKIYLKDGFYKGPYDRLALIIWSVDTSTESTFSYFPSSCSLQCSTHNGSFNTLVSGIPFHYDNPDGFTTRRLGFSCVFDISSISENQDISAIDLVGSGSVPDSVYISVFMYDSTNGGDLQAVIQSINSQTVILNDSLQNGNGSTQSTINGSQSELDSTTNQFNNMNDRLNEYDDIESGFISDYDSAMDGIDSIVNGFTFDGILPAAQWLSTQMTSRYNVMSDFKFFVIFPVIFAISLVMIGGSIGKRF